MKFRFCRGILDISGQTLLTTQFQIFTKENDSFFLLKIGMSEFFLGFETQKSGQF